MKWLPLIALIVGGLALVLRGEGQTIAGFSDQDFASLLIGGTLLVFIGTSVLAGYRGQIGTALKHLGVWALIAGGLMGGYVYKAEVVELAHRITGELMPPGSAMRNDTQVDSERSVRIRKRSDGHFVVKTQVNGVQLSMLVDTGASTVVLKPADAQKLGIDPDRLRYSVPVQTANGTTYAAHVRLRSLTLGSISLTDVEALVAKPGALKENLLGMSFLSRLRSYEFSGDFLTLRS